MLRIPVILFSTALVIVATVLMVTLENGPAIGGGTNVAALMAIDTDPTGNGSRVSGGLGTADAGEGDQNGPGCLDDGNGSNGVGLGEDDDGDGFTDEGCPTLGTVENCARINENDMLDADEDAIDTLFIDVVIQDIPSTNRLFGFHFELNYPNSPNSIKVSGQGIAALPDGTPANAASDSRWLLFAVPESGGQGTQELDEGNETDATADGSWEADDIDSSVLTPDATEEGDGVLKRIRIQSTETAQSGVYFLALNEAYHLDQTNTARMPTVAAGANISIDAPCTPPSLLKQGDVNCSTTVNSIDALLILRFAAGLSVTQMEPCTDINTPEGAYIMGNVDCSVGGNAVTSVDALKVLRFNASLSVIQTEPCPDINTSLN
jgi:hypothetical protein